MDDRLFLEANLVTTYSLTVEAPCGRVAKSMTVEVQLDVTKKKGWTYTFGASVPGTFDRYPDCWVLF